MFAAGHPIFVTVDKKRVPALFGVGVGQPAARRAAEARLARRAVKQRAARHVGEKSVAGCGRPTLYLAFVPDDVQGHRGDERGGGAALGQLELRRDTSLERGAPAAIRFGHGETGIVRALERGDVRSGQGSLLVRGSSSGPEPLSEFTGQTDGFSLLGNLNPVNSHSHPSQLFFIPFSLTASAQTVRLARFEITGLLEDFNSETPKRGFRTP